MSVITMPNCSLFSGFVPCYPPSCFLCTLITHTCSLLFCSCTEKATAILMWLHQPALDPRSGKTLSVLRTDEHMIWHKFSQSSPLAGMQYVYVVYISSLLCCRGAFQVRICIVSYYKTCWICEASAL